MSNQLLPCPFCGSTDLYQSTSGVDSYFVGCHQCGAEGPVVLSAVLSAKDEASAAWNRRATQPAAPVAAGEPVHQWADGILWQDSDEAELASARAEGFKTRTLWTAPPAAAPVAAGEPVAWQCRLDDQDWRECSREHHEHIQSCPEGSWPGYETRELFAAPPAAAHGGELVAVVGTVPDGSGFKSLDFKVELQGLPDGTRLYAAHGDEALPNLVPGLQWAIDYCNAMLRQGNDRMLVEVIRTRLENARDIQPAAMRAQAGEGESA